jgi:myo-inositol 2-dehydrogenase / D-chiro-inositol 1-dehydrogenase
MSDSNTRRNFLTAAAAGFTIMKPETVRGYQANSALSVGLVGCGRRGTAISGIFAKNEFAKIAAISDIYDDQLSAAAKMFSGARQFKNWQELVTSDVDAVYIASPPYLHPEHFEGAVKARKHIFCEKPAGVDPAGAKRILEASKKADPKKRISFDYQQRYGREYKKAYEIVKSGQIGRITVVRASWIGGGLPVRTGHPQSEEKMRNWLFYRELGGDIIVEQNCHNIDVVNWFMGTHPVKVTGYGGRTVRKDIGNIMDNLACTFQYQDGTVFSYSANQITLNNYYDVSETFMCEKGAVNVSRQGYKLYVKASRKEAPTEVATNYDITQDAVNDCVDAARTGRLENAAPWAVESTLTAIMAREAIYKGKEMTWKDVAV